VRLVNGSISTTSKPERGTTVEVEVPLNGREKAAKGAWNLMAIRACLLCVRAFIQSCEIMQTKRIESV
jgi:hypothetical protein